MTNRGGEEYGVAWLSRGSSMSSESPDFTTTHWSVVLASAQRDSPQAAVALEQLCRAYWYPLYAFVRRQEVVIKPLAPYLAALPGISGASIMGDGGVVLILDPAELLQLAVQEAV